MVHTSGARCWPSRLSKVSGAQAAACSAPAFVFRIIAERSGVRSVSSDVAVDSRERARGLLLGAAVGDALGAPFEGAVRVDERLLASAENVTGQLSYTDDTALTLVLAEHLAERRGGEDALDPDALAREFADAWAAEPWRGYGSAAQEIFRLICTGMDWRTVASASFGGQGSFGNGAAMRVAPVALVADDLADAARLARRSAVLTHAHADGEAGAALQGCAAYLALHSSPGEPLDRAAIREELRGAGIEEHWLAKLDIIAEFDPETEPERAAQLLGHGVAALESVPTALAAFLINPDSPAEVIRWAIRAGGDTDTIACMAGALAGARNGADAFPDSWIQRLEHADLLTECADRLA
ncbi:MAG: hypothetical protein GEU98_18080 [Pseudonocardiaceae bacterium]|nr:hypothetical protein [Pseudonocardiaceae bacterium]